MNILEELYYGNISPIDKCFDRKSGYGNFLKIISDNEQILSEYFERQGDEEEHHLFSQMMNAQIEVQSFCELERFIDGFRLGAGFMLDTFMCHEKSAVMDIN